MNARVTTPSEIAARRAHAPVGACEWISLSERSEATSNTNAIEAQIAETVADAPSASGVRSPIARQMRAGASVRGSGAIPRRCSQPVAGADRVAA